MNDIQIFQNEQFGKVRIVEIDGEPWFVGKDVADALGYTNPQKAIRDHVCAEDKGVNETFTPQGGGQLTTVINEPGLYSLILGSKLPSAQAFKRWITHDVLPSIRKHGAFMTTAKMEEIMQNPDSWIVLMTALKKERDEKVAAQERVKALEPKAQFADAVVASEDCISVGTLAKILCGNGLDIGRNRLFESLRLYGFLTRGAAHNMPTQRAMDLGLFKVKETVILHSTSPSTLTQTVKVTGRGQQYFVNFFLQKGKDQLREQNVGGNHGL